MSPSPQLFLELLSWTPLCPLGSCNPAVSGWRRSLHPGGPTLEVACLISRLRSLLWDKALVRAEDMVNALLHSTREGKPPVSRTCYYDDSCFAAVKVIALQ